MTNDNSDSIVGGNGESKKTDNVVITKKWEQAIIEGMLGGVSLNPPEDLDLLLEQQWEVMHAAERDTCAAAAALSGMPVAPNPVDGQKALTVFDRGGARCDNCVYGGKHPASEQKDVCPAGKLSMIALRILDENIGVK